MGHIGFDTATTINGWIADEHDSLAWLFAVPGSGEAEQEVELHDAAVVVMGSTTYGGSSTSSTRSPIPADGTRSRRAPPSSSSRAASTRRPWVPTSAS